MSVRQQIQRKTVLKNEAQKKKMLDCLLKFLSFGALPKAEPKQVESMKPPRWIFRVRGKKIQHLCKEKLSSKTSFLAQYGRNLQSAFGLSLGGLFFFFTCTITPVCP